MANTYYDSQLTAEEIEAALEAIDGLIVPANNGKVLAVENGVLVAKSVTEYTGSAVLEALSVSANGDYYPGSGVDGFDEVHVLVPSSQPNLQSKTVTQNGTVTPDAGYDGLSSVVVNVSGGSGSSFPAVQAMYDGQLMFGFYGSVLQTNSSSVRKFLTDYARDRYGNQKGSQNSQPTLAQVVNITPSILTESLSDFLSRFQILSQAEYSGYVYDRTSMIEDLGLVLLGDFSQGGESSGNALSDSIENYSAVLLQGIYQKQRTSVYNTSRLYISPVLNTAYWTGMKDRNQSYDCNVTFTDAQTVSLSGNKQVIIYGVP